MFGNYQVFNIVTGGSSVEQLALFAPFALVDNNTVRGAGDLIILFADLSATCSNVASSQPNISGSFGFNNTIGANKMLYSNTTSFATDPENVQNALDRIASVLFTNFGPIP